MLIWHYTSIGVLLELLTKDSSLLATHISFLNDSRDGQFSSEHLVSYLHQQLAWNDKFCTPESIRKTEPYLRQGLLRPRFVTCFSKLRDDLSQWREYARENGIAMGFDFDEIKSHLIYPSGCTVKYDLRECKYLSEHDEEKLINEIKKQISDFDNRNILEHYEQKEVTISQEINKQAFDALFLKNCSFKAEEEVRYGIMYDGFYSYSDAIIINNSPRVPLYLDVPIKQLIKEIIISPYNYTNGKMNSNIELLVNILWLQSHLKFIVTKSQISIAK